MGRLFGAWRPLAALAAALAAGCAAGPAARPGPPLVLDGVLREVSPAPNFTVYRRALVLYTYQVDRVLSGSYPHGRVQVYHWAIVEHRPQKEVVGRSRGETFRLALEPFERYPDLEREDRTETVMDFDLPLFMDVGAGDPLGPLRTGAKASP